MKNAVARVRGEAQRNIVKLLEGLSNRYSKWEVWQDFIIMSGIGIANALGSPYKEDREKQYISRAQKYSREEMEAFAQMFAEVTLELDRNPDQDFLGDLFMSLDLPWTLETSGRGSSLPHTACAGLCPPSHTETT